MPRGKAGAAPSTIADLKAELAAVQERLAAAKAAHRQELAAVIEKVGLEELELPVLAGALDFLKEIIERNPEQLEKFRERAGRYGFRRAGRPAASGGKKTPPASAPPVVDPSADEKHEPQGANA